MSMEWIKMRRSLQSHPKVVRILSATASDKFRVIGGLHAVWGVFDEHSVDGALKGYTPELLDHIIGWEGFARAMESVGWLHFDGMETLTLPEFTEHNGQSAKRRAEDQKRKRESRKSPQSVRNLSADDADEMRTRKRKEREEEKKEQEQEQRAARDARPPSGMALAEQLFPEADPKHLRDWMTVRKQKRLALTETAAERFRTEAKKAGLSVRDAIKECAERGWGGLNAGWDTLQKGGGKPSSGYQPWPGEI